MAKASTQAALTVTVTMLEKVYETGRKRAEGFYESMTIAFDKVLPKWNYRKIPSKPRNREVIPGRFLSYQSW